ncbi:hypothetical protein, partial [Ralstonia pseudosolanacearum]
MRPFNRRARPGNQGNSAGFIGANGDLKAAAAQITNAQGGQTLNNREHALIFSGGDMAIGGALDSNRVATGSAATVNNNSASIESL